MPALYSVVNSRIDTTGSRMTASRPMFWKVSRMVASPDTNRLYEKKYPVPRRNTARTK